MRVEARGTLSQVGLAYSLRVSEKKARYQHDFPEVNLCSSVEEQA
jgi:hypothetical protein